MSAKCSLTDAALSLKQMIVAPRHIADKSLFNVKYSFQRFRTLRLIKFNVV